MPDEILGNYALTLQGVMHARNPINQRAIDSTSATLNVGLGGQVDVTKTGWVPVDFAHFGFETMSDQPPAPTPKKTADRPALTAFFPTRDPDPAGAAYVANHGFYPYAEIGVLTFQTEGRVNGSLRINTSGFTVGGLLVSVSGGYIFDPGSILSGVISLQFQQTPNHVWDYFFVRASPNELSVITGDRLPRPAVAAGTLRRIDHKR